MMLYNKRILLGITGSIAVYKTLDLISLLKAEGADVKVILTNSALKFITSFTFTSLIGSEGSVFTDKDFFSKALLHIELSRWANIMVIAPASANIISKMAKGITDNLLLNTYLAFNKLVALAPAMNPIMWSQPSVVSNVEILKNYGVNILGPAEGLAACGDEGLGKMLSVRDIYSYIYKAVMPKPLLNKKVLVTAGPTVEELDEVRFLSNYSSGKMGYEIAKAANALGADVTLVSGPSCLEEPKVKEFIKVKSAQEMEQACFNNAQNLDFLIMAAAVSDFSFKNKFKGKVSKDYMKNTIELEKNNDILASLCKQLKPKPFCVGFAIEATDIFNKATNKLLKKKADVIIANRIGLKTGFNSDTNEVFVITKNNITKLPLTQKYHIAIAIWTEVLSIYININTSS